MNDQMAKLLQELANKLGTTVDYLWSVMVKQAFVEGIITIIYILLCIISGVLIYRLHLKLLKPLGEGRYPSNLYDKYDDFSGIGMTILCIIWLIFSITIFCVGIQDMIRCFLTPEYWALDKILDKLKN